MLDLPGRSFNKQLVSDDYVPGQTSLSPEDQRMNVTQVFCHRLSSRPIYDLLYAVYGMGGKSFRSKVVCDRKQVFLPALVLVNCRGRSEPSPTVLQGENSGLATRPGAKRCLDFSPAANYKERGASRAEAGAWLSSPHSKKILYGSNRTGLGKCVRGSGDRHLSAPARFGSRALKSCSVLRGSNGSPYWDPASRDKFSLSNPSGVSVSPLSAYLRHSGGRSSSGKIPKT